MKTTETLWPPKPKALFSTAIGSRPPACSGRGSVATSTVTPSSGIFQVDRRRGGPVVQGEDRGHRFDRARAAEQVPGHRLGGGDHDPFRRRAQGLLDGLRLGHVALRRGGGVRVDVHDLVRGDVARRPARAAWPG